MKKIIIIILLFAFVNRTSAQQQSITGNSYITIVDNMTVYGVRSNGSIDREQFFKVPKGTKFNANGLDSSNNIRITFWNYPNPSDTSKAHKVPKMGKASLPQGYSSNYSAAKEFIGNWANDKEFIVDLKDFNSCCKLYYGKRFDFAWGVMTLPIKARLGNGDDRFFDVEENLNLGFTFGLRHQLPGVKEQALNYLLGVSIARVRADSISLKNNFKAPQSSVASALMFSGGVLYQYETFQIGIFVGFDNVMGELGRNWKFQSRPWIGFAVGVSLFSRNGTQAGTSGNNSEK
jgi:hypothetical protein